jgi:glycosyltransferase involved in cell wall biosynthesis
VLVVSEGTGARWLAERASAQHLPALVVLPFQPFESMPEVLASADVLLAVLEPDAGTFSVPSKVLTYLCAGRPLLAAMPSENLAARIIEGCGAGVVVAPDSRHAFVEAARRRLDAEQARTAAGARARAYAERTFDIERIADRFEALLDRIPRACAHVDREALPA